MRSLAWGMRWYAVALGSSYIFRLARVAVVPKLLPPDQFGLASSLLLPLTYLRFCDLGVLDQLAKRLPFFRAREGEEAFRRHLSLGTGWTLPTALLAAVGLYVASFWARGPNADFYRYGLRLVGLLLVAQKTHLLLTVTLNAREQFHFSQSGTILAELTGQVIYPVVFILLFGPMGVIWALLLSEVTTSAYLLVKAGLPRLSYALRSTITMVREGFVLFCLALSNLALITLDQVFLLRFFPIGDYGIYVAGSFLANVLSSVAILFEVNLPRVMHLTGLGREKEAKQVVASTLSLFGLAASVGVWFGPAAALAIRFYLTRYQSGTRLYILMPLLAMARLPDLLLHPYFLARNEERRLISAHLVGILTIVAIDTLVVWQHAGIVGIALASICGCSVSSAILVVRFEGSVAAVAKHLKRYATLVAAAIAVGGLYLFGITRFPGGTQPVGLVGMFSGAFVGTLVSAAVIYFSRSDWLGALKVVRAQPNVGAAETNAALADVQLAE